MSSWAKYREFVKVPPRSRNAAEEAAARRRARKHDCSWPGCKAEGTHKAPANKQTVGDARRYRWLCEAHVREFNKSWNYFDGMSDDDVARFQKEAATGHRPTWGVGSNRGAAAASRFGFVGSEADPTVYDPFGFATDGGTTTAPDGARRRLRPKEAKSLETLGLDGDATADDIKTNYKRLVKLHHPDANGGDRSSEDRLRSVIDAYNYLKSTGYC
ncbi:J domain-containing protein [Pyruvatibacter mobilis]|uniref:J domain-containing protein n=1 Tax=Pyruvatibacter mobilis TaxID=1712261 RepID=UPI003BA8BF08